MVDAAICISRRTFLRHVDRNDLHEFENAAGYAQHPSRGLTMSADYAVAYYRSKLHGERVYYFVHSAIEYVFQTLRKDHGNENKMLRDVRGEPRRTQVQSSIAD